MLVTDASLVQLHELESAIIKHMPFAPTGARNHVLLELSPESFISWSSESPIGLVLALSIVLQEFRGARKARYVARSAELLTFLRKGLHTLKFMEVELEKCIAQVE